MDTASQQDLVELLFIALYQDGHLSIEEDGALERALKALGWEPSERSGPSVGAAFAAVRTGNSSDESREIFMAERTARLRQAGHSAVALEWLGKVLGSDGFERDEERFFERVRKQLFD